MSENLKAYQDHLHFYFDFISQPSRALYILLKEGGKPFGAHSLNLLDGEHTTDEYKTRVNRFQKVPAIIDGDFKLSESVAILRYLAQKDYIPINWYPNDLYQRARVDEFLQWQHTGVRSSCSLYFRFVWVQTHFFGEPAAPGKVAKYKMEMERDLGLLEDLWLKETKFVAGKDMTAADVFGACEVEQIRMTGYDVHKRYPKVAAWIETVREQTNPHFDVAHQLVYKYEIETKAKL